MDVYIESTLFCEISFKLVRIKMVILIAIEKPKHNTTHQALQGAPN